MSTESPHDVDPPEGVDIPDEVKGVELPVVKGHKYSGLFHSSLLSSCDDGSNCLKLDNLYPYSPVPVSTAVPESNLMDIIRKLSAEALGTAILIIVVVGSGIMAETLSPSDVGLQQHASLLWRG